MNVEFEIERLRAIAIVSGTVVQAVIERMPQDWRMQLAADLRGKLEHFTVRTLNSSMPEDFVTAQSRHAAAWIAVAEEAARAP